MRDRCPYDGDRLDGASVCPTCQRVFAPVYAPDDEEEEAPIEQP